MIVENVLDSRLSYAVVLVAVLFFIKRRFFSSNNAKNWKAPFKNDTRLPTTALETDQEKRNAILKKVFNADIATKQKWDAVVIGSGIGGMSAAAVLSKAGMKVLVLEKHGKCGGACHIFCAEGYEFDVGIHYIGQFNHQTVVRTLLEQISDGQIQWAPLDTNYDAVLVDAGSPQQRRYNIPSGRGVWKKQLLQQFPDETEAIEKFFNLVDRITKAKNAFVIVKILPIWIVRLCDKLGLLNLFSDFFAFGHRTLKDVVEGLTSNPDLQLLLTYSWGDYGTPPSRGSFSLQALLTSHYEHGASYPVGGASEIPYRIAPIIERAGGQVMMKAPVTEILIENGKVAGVRVGSKKSGKSVDIHAPIVISDAGVYNTFKKLLPEDVAQTSPTWPLVCSAKPGVGCFSVFVGLRGTTEELGLTAQNIWAYNGNHYEKDFETFTQSNLEDILYKPYPFYFIGFPSAKDPTWESRYPGRSTITIVSFASYSWFEQWTELAVKKRGDEYNSLKNALGQQLIDQVVQIYPQLKDAVDYFCVGTPITNEHYLNSHQGAIYGLDHPRERFLPYQSSLLRPKTGIDGLYLVGQDVMTSGFVSSLMSGLIASSCVLKTNLMQELTKLHKQLKRNGDTFKHD